MSIKSRQPSQPMTKPPRRDAEPDMDDRGGPSDNDIDDMKAKRKKLAIMVATGGMK